MFSSERRRRQERLERETRGLGDWVVVVTRDYHRTSRQSCREKVYS